MKRIYLFRKKIGFPVCKKEISPAFKRTGRAERALVPVLLRITHHLRSWVLVSLPKLCPPWSSPARLLIFPSPQSPFDTKGSLSNNDGDGFKLCSSYSISFNTSNVGNIIGSWILLKGLYQRSGKEKRKLLSCVPVLDKTWIRHFHTSSLATTANKCTKKRDARAKLLFCQSKPVAFLSFSFSLPSPSSLPNLPKEERDWREREVSEKLPTYPSPKLTLTLSSYLGQNDGLGEG